MSAPTPLRVAMQHAQQLQQAGDLTAARAVLDQAIAGGRATLRDDDPDMMAAALQLAVVHRAGDDLSTARRLLEEAYAAGQWRYGDGDPLLVMVSFELGGVADDLGNRHEARRAFGRVAAHGAQALGAEHWAVRQARVYLGEDPPTVRLSLPEGRVEQLGADRAARGAEPSASAPPVPSRSAHEAPPGYSGPSREVPTAYPGPSHVVQPGPPEPSREMQPAHPEAPHEVPPGHPGLSHEMPAVRSGPPFRNPPVQVSPLVPAGPSGEAGYRQPGSAPPMSGGPSGFGATSEYGVGPGGGPGAALRFGRDGSEAGREEIVRDERAASQEKGGRGRNTAVFAAVAATLAVVAAVVALVVVLARPGGGGDDDGGKAVVAGEPPSDVRLTDSGSSVALSWADPSDGTVSFLITGGHRGQQLTGMGNVAAGRRSFELHALNPQINYCFAVLAVYGANQFAPSEPVCTNRVAGAPQPTRTG